MAFPPLAPRPPVGVPARSHSRFSLRLTAVALVGALVLPIAASTVAEAGDRRHGWHGHHHRRDKGIDAGAAIALGVIGLAAGAMTASSANRPEPIYPPYYGPAYGPHYGSSYGPAYRPGYTPGYDHYIPEADTYIDPANRSTGFVKPYYPNPPTVVYYGNGHRGGLEPWSAEWYAYCAERYRSFDARTGTFTTHSGQKRFCR